MSLQTHSAHILWPRLQDNAFDTSPLRLYSSVPKHTGHVSSVSSVGSLLTLRCRLEDRVCTGMMWLRVRVPL